MIANRILDFILHIFAFVVIPVQLATTFLLGIAVNLTFGLLLFPISLVWCILLFPMLGVSWLCHKIPFLRNIIGVIFIPWALVGNTYVCLMPSMGELENRASKLMLFEAWPFTWEFWRFLGHRVDLESPNPESAALNEVVERISCGDPFRQRVIMRVSCGEELDPNV